MGEKSLYILNTNHMLAQTIFPFLGSQLLIKYLPKLTGYPSQTMRIMFEEIDARTFFETANIILKDHNTYQFHDLPYALIANKQDRTVNFDYVYEILSRNVMKLLVMNTEIDHYPRDISKTYFKKMVREEIIQKITVFFSQNAVVSTT